MGCALCGEIWVAIIHSSWRIKIYDAPNWPNVWGVHCVVRTGQLLFTDHGELLQL